MASALDPKNFNQGAEYARDYWHCEVPNDTLLTDILKSSFWVHVMSRLKPHALIDVMTFDGLLDVQLRVSKIANGIAVMRPRMVFEDTEARAPILAAMAAAKTNLTGLDAAAEIRDKVPEGYKVGWNPGKKNYYVQIKGSGAKVAENIATRDEALAFAIKHAAVANAPMGVVQEQKVA
jgi:hypothetical protein